jgi:transposase
MVSHTFALDPFSHCLFVFCNRERNKLKILFWDHNGFWLYYRRLERGRFRWPARGAGQARAISRRELQWLLDGLELEQKQAHASVTARSVV